jgi:DNA-directed RNA polymerase sigma subunit (sigma70/sigma32)
MRDGAPYGGDLVKAMKAIRSERDVARILGISRSRVFQIERSALRKVCDRLLESVDPRRLEV